MVLEHGVAIQRLVSTLVASRAADLGDITALAFAIDREGIGQRHHVGIIHITRHAYAVIGGDTLRRAALPALEVTRVMSIGAIDAE